MIRPIVPGVLGVAFAMSAPQIASAAYVNVDAGWGVGLGFTSDRPDGIDVEGSEGTELADIHTFTGKENKTFTSTARFTVTNTLDAPFHDSNFWFDVDFSAFNPGGDWIGLSIDNPGQRASFSSTVEGPEAYDTHSCALPASATDVDGYTYFSTMACGAAAPDSDDFPLYVTDLAPGETQTFTYTITISDSFTPAPEPSGLLVLTPMVLGLGLLRSRAGFSRPIGNAPRP